MTNEEFIKSVSLEGEIWKDVKGFENQYAISDYGRIFSHKAKKLLVQSLSNKGYCIIKLGRKNKFLVHRLVYDTFVGYTNKNAITNHKNSIKTDNRLENLEECDYRYNSIYAYRHKERTVKAIIQYTLNGEYICTYETAMDAYLKTNVSRSSICNCCKGKAKSAGGFLWSYKGEYPKEYTPYKDNCIKVAQYTIDGSLIKIWNSLAEASTITYSSNICKCCKGEYKSAGGYKWKYVDSHEALINKSKNESKPTQNDYQQEQPPQHPQGLQLPLQFEP